MKPEGQEHINEAKILPMAEAWAQTGTAQRLTNQSSGRLVGAQNWPSLKYAIKIMHVAHQFAPDRISQQMRLRICGECVHAFPSRRLRILREVVDLKNVYHWLRSS